MKGNVQLIIWYSGLAILAGIILRDWKGSNAILGTFFKGASGYVGALKAR
jgi:hypothetical protein